MLKTNHSLSNCWMNKKSSFRILPQFLNSCGFIFWVAPKLDLVKRVSGLFSCLLPLWTLVRIPPQTRVLLVDWGFSPFLIAWLVGFPIWSLSSQFKNWTLIACAVENVTKILIPFLFGFFVFFCWKKHITPSGKWLHQNKWFLNKWFCFFIRLETYIPTGRAWSTMPHWHHYIHVNCTQKNVSNDSV